MIFIFVLIGRCDYFGFGCFLYISVFTTLSKHFLLLVGFHVFMKLFGDDLEIFLTVISVYIGYIQFAATEHVLNWPTITILVLTLSRGARPNT